MVLLEVESVCVLMEVTMTLYPFPEMRSVIGADVACREINVTLLEPLLIPIHSTLYSSIKAVFAGGIQFTVKPVVDTLVKKTLTTFKSVTET